MAYNKIQFIPSYLRHEKNTDCKYDAVVSYVNGAG